MSEQTSANIRDRFRKLAERRYVPYTCPALGDIYLRSVTAKERMEIELKKVDEDGGFSVEAFTDLTAWQIIYTVCDEDNNTVFSPNDLEMLNSLDEQVIDPLRDAIKAHAFREQDTAGAKKN